MFCPLKVVWPKWFQTSEHCAQPVCMYLELYSSLVKPSAKNFLLCSPSKSGFVVVPVVFYLTIKLLSFYTLKEGAEMVSIFFWLASEPVCGMKSPPVVFWLD